MEPRVAVAVVTGAARGIGRAVALRLRDDGFAVAAADIEPVGAADGILPCPLDVADIGEHDRVLDQVEAELGPLAALVNVAGMFVAEKLEHLTMAAWRRQHAVMLDGPVWLARSAGLRMAERGSGRIVNVTSVHASNGETASLAYDTAKAGLEAASRNLAIELGPRGVLVNSVAPGFTRTRMSVVDGVDELESEWFRADLPRAWSAPAAPGRRAGRDRGYRQPSGLSRQYLSDGSADRRRRRFARHILKGRTRNAHAAPHGPDNLRP